MTKSSTLSEPYHEATSPERIIRAAGELAMLRTALKIVFASKDLDEAIKQLVELRGRYADYPFPQRRSETNNERESGRDTQSVS